MYLNRRSWLFVIPTVLALSSGCLGGLRDDVERLLRAAPLKGATVAVSIRDVDSDLPLVSINDRQPMTPASNMKLLTTGAALHALGEKFEFSTKFVRAGDRLIVIGDGDPAFGDPSLLKEMSVNGSTGMSADAFLGLWVNPVLDAGITSVSEIVVDDRIFDREFIHPTWPMDQLNNDYCAQVSGLNFHANVFHFFPKPRAGQPPAVSDCQPAAPWLKITNNATSRQGKGEKATLGIIRKMGSNDLTFRGNVRVPYRDPVAVTAHDMPMVFGQLLADRLQRSGVTVKGHRLSTPDEPASTASSGTPIGPAITTSLATVLTRCNRDSENLYAESLLKRVGHTMTGAPGSFVNGSAIIRHIVHERLGSPDLAGTVVVADGSGLSQDNRISAGMMTAWLASFANDQKLGPLFIESLAVAGQSGTLKKRYAKTNLYGASVQAKTGYINRVSCLSGYVTMADGRRRTFSVLVNGLRADCLSHAKALQDQIVVAIAEDMAATGIHLGSD